MTTSVGLSGNQRIERDDAQRPILDYVLHERRPLPEVGVLGKGAAQRAALIVVPRDQVHRHRQRREQLPQVRVFGGEAALHQVAGGDHHIGPLLQAQDFLHAALQHGRAIYPAKGKLAGLPDVQVADLADQQGFSPA